jgi:hypothetical protein
MDVCKPLRPNVLGLISSTTFGLNYLGTKHRKVYQSAAMSGCSNTDWQEHWWQLLLAPTVQEGFP